MKFGKEFEISLSNKERLVKKIKKDLKLDRIMSLFSLLLFTIVFILWTTKIVSIELMGIFAVHFLVWFNSLLLTQRDKKIMEELK